MKLLQKTQKLRLFKPEFFLIALLTLIGCSSTGFRSQGSAVFNTGNIILVSEKSDKNEILLYNSTGIKKLDNIVIPGSINRVYKMGDYTACITDKDGIFLLNGKTMRVVNIPVSDNAIQHNAIYDLYMIEQKNRSVLYITYISPAGNGVTECTIEKDSLVGCKTLTTANSDLKSNFVHQVTSDSKGNMWYRYSPVSAAGVSRRNVNGTWNHYDKYNSNLGDNIVSLIKPEPANIGFPGENVWFVTRAGLTRLSFGAKDKEDWFFYGDKKTFVNTLANAVGIEQWFTDAIIDIIDIEFLSKSVLIANKYALFNFSEKNVERFLPANTGGLDELQISGIQMRQNNVYVMIRPLRDKTALVRYLMSFDIDKKKWNDIKYWDYTRSYASMATISELSAKTDFIHFNYLSGESRFAVYDLSTEKLTEVVFQ